MLFLPDLVPKTLEELAGRKDEDAKLAKEEDAWNAKVLLGLLDVGYDWDGVLRCRSGALSGKTCGDAFYLLLPVWHNGSSCLPYTQDMLGAVVRYVSLGCAAASHPGLQAK